MLTVMYMMWDGWGLADATPSAAFTYPEFSLRSQSGIVYLKSQSEIVEIGAGSDGR